MFNSLGEWWAWYRASEFSQATLAVPLVETTALLVAITICLLFRFSRTGLMLAFLFLYRWGWMVRIQHFTADPGIQAVFSVSYLIFGVGIFAFATVGMIRRGRDDT